MGIRITKTVNWGKYTKRIKNIDQKLLGLSEEIIVGIIKRTQSGKDIYGRKFRKYSKGYKKPGGTSTVNLTLKGTMLHAIDTKKIRRGIRFYFPNATENKKAHDNQVKYKRKFLGLDKKQIKALKIDLLKYFVRK